MLPGKARPPFGAERVRRIPFEFVDSVETAWRVGEDFEENACSYRRPNKKTIEEAPPTRRNRAAGSLRKHAPFATPPWGVYHSGCFVHPMGKTPQGVPGAERTRH